MPRSVDADFMRATVFKGIGRASFEVEVLTSFTVAQAAPFSLILA